MKLLLTLCLVATTLAVEDALRDILKSPKKTLQLYDNFKAQEHLKFEVNEDRLRFQLFRSNAELIADANEHSDNAVFAQNFFSTMTADEKKQYLGLNITGHNANAPRAASAGFQAPAEKLWTNVDAVTRVKNQGSCGSCWTFGAVGGLETRYQQKSGKLRKFSEQEYLDCVYEGSKDGCRGGWPSNCYSYSKDNGGRLASDKDYPYRGSDGACQGSSKPNAAVAYKIDGYVDVDATESANIEALASGSLSVAFEVTDYFQQYSKGIIKDTTCKGRPNHAVTAVGYSVKYVLVKNSWGTRWGDQGFVKFARGYSNCGLFHFSSYPKLKSTGKSDNTPSDGATNYRPSDDDNGPAPGPVCEDKALDCTKSFCKFADFAKKHCQRTCGYCDDDEGGDCPSGTVRCSDGVCRHEHMC